MTNSIGTFDKFPGYAKIQPYRKRPEGKMKKIIVKLEPIEQRIIVNILNEKRNELLREEKDTTPIDEILLKVIDGKKSIF